ncbi:hypothetical protein H4582DRAFT_2104611 [Lactarius indigo]|nr:hypothetical protein H4582DRAFT_2104611 [Lactarius indigo]
MLYKLQLQFHLVPNHQDHCYYRRRHCADRGLEKGYWKTPNRTDFSAYPTRKIALKFSYPGFRAGYGGLPCRAGPTPLLSVEVMGVYSCSTDKCFPLHASAFGVSGNAPERGLLNDHDAPALMVPYRGTRRVFVLRALHCKSLFSMRGLDVDAMCANTAWLVDGHYFRNLCELDSEKQLTSFQRWVMCPIVISSMHGLDLVGGAFLYNRCSTVARTVEPATRGAGSMLT